MKNFEKSTILLVLFGLLTISCTKEEEKIITEYVAKQQAVITARSWSWSSESTSWAGGRIFAEKFPVFESMKINDSLNSGPEYVSYNTWNGMRIGGNGNYNNGNLNIEIKTSAGTISCSITEPDTLISYTFSCGDDTLQPGEDLIVTWECDNADFYRIWYDIYGDESRWVDTVIRGKQLTISGELLTKLNARQIIFEDITTVIGSMPEPGAQANMTGEGSGFLYYMNYNGTSSYMRKEIWIDNGSKTTVTREKPDKEKKHERVYESFAKRLGF